MIHCFSYEELSDEAKENVLAQMQDINIDSDWSEFLLDDAKEGLKNKGYYNPKIYFSGFWSQGDGASFEAGIDIQAWLKAHKLSNKYRAIYNNPDDVTIHIYKRGHYEHEMTMHVECGSYSDNEKVNNTIDELGDLILETAREEARSIYKELEKEYYYLTSKEAIEETITANEYQFTQSGSRSIYL